MTMGIYSDGKIYGVSLILDDRTIFELTSTEILNLDEIHMVKENYYELTNKQKNNTIIRFYMSCSSTYNSNTDSFMTWFPGSQDVLERLFAS
jgi:hypothetical protein